MPTDRHKAGRRHSQPTRWWPLVTALLVLAVGISLLVPQARHQWALSLIRQPTYFTAISFDQPSSLPTRVVETEPVSFAFTIDDQEGRSIAYRYVVRASCPAGTSRATSGTAAVPADGSRSIRTVLRPNCTTSPWKVEVSLPGYPETIDFLATVVPAGAEHG